jgi:hypothetical protein
MKKVLLLTTAFLFFISLSAYAQYSGIEIGLKQGSTLESYDHSDFYADLTELNYSSYANSDGAIAIGAFLGLSFASLSDVSGDGKTGFHAGLFAVIAFSELLAFMPELYFSTQGDKEGSNEINLSYVYINLLLRIHILAGLYALVGPQVGFNTKSEFSFSGSGTIDQKDNTNALDIGLAIGAMYQLLRFHVYARYVLGLTNIYDFDGASEKIRMFQLGLAIRLFGGA